MRIIFLLATILQFAVGSISDCDSTSLFRPLNLTLTPDPPIRGNDVYMTLQFENPSTAVTDGKSTTTIILNGLPISPTTTPLCEATVCPLVTGFNDRSTQSVWPDITGKLISKIAWSGQNGESLLCIQISVRVTQ